MHSNKDADHPSLRVAGGAILLFAAVFLFAMVFFTSCGKKQSTASVFTFGLATEVDDYDPFTNLTADSRSVLFNIYEGLVRVASNEEMAETGENGQSELPSEAIHNTSTRYRPCLADRWEHNEDATEWTFWIKLDVHFHDGSVMSTEDAARSILMARDSGFAGMTNVKDVEAEGGTVKVRLSSPDTSFAAAMTCPIVKYAASSSLHGEAEATPLGTGPYMLKSYTPGDCCILSRFDGYHGEKPALPAVKVKFIGTQSALPLSLLSGAIDGFVATGDLSDEVGDKGKHYRAPSNAVQMLALNNSAPQFHDVRVRRAVQCLIDSDDVIKSAARGYGVRAPSPVIPALMAADKELLDKCAYNVAKGTSLLREAGAADLSFTITVPSAYTVHVKTAEVIADMLSRAGVKTAIEQVDWATWLSEVYIGRRYEATIVSVDAPLATSEAFLSRYVSTASDNFVNFNSPSFDDAFSALRKQATEEGKALCTKQALNILVEQAASVWIEDIEQVTVLGKGYTGFKSYPLFAIDFAAIGKGD